MVHFTRFFLNSLLGMGGFIDVAGMANQKLQREQPHRSAVLWAIMALVTARTWQLPFNGSLRSVMKAEILDTLFRF
jgi:phospholipid-binding lipoprotein MlaA